MRRPGRARNVGAVASALEGKVCLITGANTGIGRVAAEALAARGARVLLAGRSEERTAPVVEAIRAQAGAAFASFLPLDLASLASVRSGAEAVLARDGPLDLLINNAGLAGQRGQTEDGFELAFGVNHLGHFLLTLLLVERVRAAAPARIVNVASTAHYQADGIDFEAVRRATATVSGLPEYAVSKLANVLFTRELARRLAGSGVTTYALHPGVVATEIWRRLPRPIAWLATRFMRSPERGAETTLHCATSPEVAGESGLYYDDCRVREPSAAARDDALAADLWARSLEWTGAPDLAPPA